MGGDEFTLILNNITCQQNALLVGNKIIASLAQPFSLDGQQCYIGCSVGISLYPDDSIDGKSLLDFADQAMYLAKNNGKNNCKFYQDLR